VELNNYTEEIPVIEGTPSLKELDDLIARPTTTNPDKKYYIALSISLSMLSLGVIGVLLTFIMESECGVIISGCMGF